jgi:uncharacterized membrane protein YphA (DoxX/SURF4 family)
MSYITIRAGFCHRILSFFLGLVLLLAAFLKGHEILTQPVGDGWSGSVALQTAWVLVEVSLGLFLASGLFPRAARFVGAGLFLFLSLFALRGAAAGAESCGCFGQVRMNPWLVFGSDIASAVLLAALPCLVKV